MHRHGAGTPQYVWPYQNMERHLSVALGHHEPASIAHPIDKAPPGCMHASVAFGHDVSAAHDGINAEVGCMHPHLEPTKVAHPVDDNAQLCCMHPSVAIGHHEPASIAHTVSNNAEVGCMHP